MKTVGMKRNHFRAVRSFDGMRLAAGVSLCLFAGACSSGCATVINGRIQQVAVASDPPGARVYVNGAPAGVTPVFVEVPRRDPDLELRLEKKGYEPTRLTLPRSRSGWSWGNPLLAGMPINDYSVESWMAAMAVYGVLGSLWDSETGGGWKRPTHVRATLGPIESESATPAEGHSDTRAAVVNSVSSDTRGKPRNRLMRKRFSDRFSPLIRGWMERYPVVSPDLEGDGRARSQPPSRR